MQTHLSLDLLSQVTGVPIPFLVRVGVGSWREVRPLHEGKFMLFLEVDKGRAEKSSYICSFSVAFKSK